MEVALERKVPCSLNCGKGRVIEGGDLKFTFRRILSSCLSEERGRRLRGGDERRERGMELGLFQALDQLFLLLLYKERPSFYISWVSTRGKIKKFTSWTDSSKFMLD